MPPRKRAAAKKAASSSAPVKKAAAKKSEAAPTPVPRGPFIAFDTVLGVAISAPSDRANAQMFANLSPHTCEVREV